ncbi:MAG: MBL fold metallo-hydrolase [Rhodoferax sp.]|uniref:MBL fold metallo-hydrolase n=1 Tax=Rhodoferax sp. TaxID=50421 RepID=UPI0017D52551|nr:MBL fold metallo-hydrolase [Rhodoferax sp.]NMM14383.1 MBL fold metallo-hydrolase [Rhodoferax sp.]NMM18629.1 MBL fold metallo-hydrolase [Rhodoferax sp.]
MSEQALPRPLLPADISVFERGWLSSNNILISGRAGTALIDSGYGDHAGQTLALVEAALQGRPLDLLLNTHLHSDHCGGNAALQHAYPALQTHIPPGLAPHVRHWDPHALTYTPTGQTCPPFGFDAVLLPGTDIQLGDRPWQVHAAPGHDPHSVILFEPASRVLVSADALWERGFGVVFPELEGVAAFDEVGQTIDLIESLAPAIVIPGHGPAFTGVAAAIGRARDRLDSFVQHPEKHIQYGAKVLLKFKLLEVQNIELAALLAWAQATPYFALIYNTHFSAQEFAPWVEQLIGDLVRSGAATRDGVMVRNA